MDQGPAYEAEPIPPDAPAYLYQQSWLYLLGLAFTLWMMLDAYRRYGFCYWQVFLLVFSPLAPAFYFLAHAREIVRGLTRGEGLFGPGLKSKIRKAEAQLRLSGTVAARMDLAELYFQAQRYDECEAAYREVLLADPEILEAHYFLGLCRLARHDHAEALKHLEQVVARDKKIRFGLAWLRYTDVLAALGRNEQALEERRALSRHFPRPVYEYAYAQLLQTSGQPEKARAVLEEMLATGESAPAEDRKWLKAGKALLRNLA